MLRTQALVTRLVRLRPFSTGIAPAPPDRGFTELKKSLIAINGPDSSKFLNGLITNKVSTDQLGFYAGFLNPKGRLIADTFIYPTHNTALFDKATNDGEGPEDSEAFIVECDDRMGDTLLSMFKRYKLRSKVQFEKLGDDQVRTWSVWDDTDIPESLGSLEDVFQPYTPKLVSALDNRSPGSFGLRLVLPSSQTPLDILSSAFKDSGGFESSTPQAYKIRRTLLGVPEGADELIPDKSLPLEACMDYMGGVDFDKGCYVGQELTIRSHHHGIVRKRVIPVVLSEEPSELQELEYDPSSVIAQTYTAACLPGSQIVNTATKSGDESLKKEFAPSPFGASSAASSASKTRPAGSLISAVGNIGLALVRLEEFSNPEGQFAIQVPNASGQGYSNVYVKGFQPYWWPE